MEHNPSTLKLLLKEDLDKLSPLFRRILEPLIYCLIQKARKAGLNKAGIYVNQKTLAEQARCSRKSANEACRLAADLGIITWSWTQKNTGPNPGHWGTNLYTIGLKYRKLWAILFAIPAKPITQSSTKPAPRVQTPEEYQAEIDRFFKTLGA